MVTRPHRRWRSRCSERPCLCRRVARRRTYQKLRHVLMVSCVFESRGACVENSRRCTAAPSLQRRNLLERSSLCTGRVQLGDDGIASGCCGFQGATTTLERRRDEWMKALVNETARDQLFAACAMGRLWKAPGCARGALTSTSGYMWSCCRSLRNVVGL